MSCDSESKNEYTFIWVIENFSRFISDPLHYDSGSKSPIFTVEFLHQSSWYMTAYFKKFQPFYNETWIACSLVRDRVDKGKETVEINCNIKLRIAGAAIDIDEYMKVNEFKRGDSCEYVFKYKGDKGKMVLPMTVECHMVEHLAVVKPISAMKNVHSLSGSLEWLKVEVTDIKTFSCPGEALIEFSFYSSDKHIGIKIRRVDKVNNIMCYLMLKVFASTKNEFFNPITSENSLKPLGVNHMFEIPIFNEERFNSLFIKSINWVSLNFICSVTTIQEQNTSEKISSNLLTNDNALCNIICPHAKIQEKNNCTQTKSDTKANDLLRNDFLRMYSNGIFTDVQLQVGSKNFPVHKCVLSARSPVLSAMLNHDMVESQKGIVEITDMDAETLDLLLKFLYTGTVGELDMENAVKLRFAAENYQVQTLKEICCNFFISALSESNVCAFLNMADTFGDNNLKVASIEYVKRHAGKVLLSEKWKQLVDENVTLVSELLKNLSVDIGTAASK